MSESISWIYSRNCTQKGVAKPSLSFLSPLKLPPTGPAACCTTSLLRRSRNSPKKSTNKICSLFAPAMKIRFRGHLRNGGEPSSATISSRVFRGPPTPTATSASLHTSCTTSSRKKLPHGPKRTAELHKHPYY